MDQEQKKEGHASHHDNPYPVERNSQNSSLLNLLKTFGLSVEDLEELSQYPDDQLTPENMPVLLQAIRKKKQAPKVPTLPSKSTEKETISSADNSGPTEKKKVIDYGHKSKYGYNEGPVEANASPTATVESTKGFRTQQPASVPAAASGLISNPKNLTKELMRQVGSQASTPSLQASPRENPAKKVPSAERGVPAAAPPVMPPAVPPVPQAVMRPATPPILSPTVNQSSFVPELMELLCRHGRSEHTARADPPNRPCQTMAGQRSFRKEAGEPFRSPFGVVKASWLPDLSQTEKQKKRQPTSSQMCDYCAVTPRIFPHTCSLCNEDCIDKKDWLQHQNTFLHNENCRQLLHQYPDWAPENLSSLKRPEGERQERHESRQRSASPSPKRSRRSGSGHARHWTRSRSRSSGSYRTSRSRSRSPSWHSVSPFPKRSRCSTSDYARYRTRSRSRSSERYRTSRPRSRSPRRLPSPRHRSRSPRQSLRSSRQPRSSSSRERRRRSRSRSSERHRTTQPKSRSPRRLPSRRHRSRSPRQSSSKEKKSGSSSRSTEGRSAKTPCSKKERDDQKQTHSSSDSRKKRGEDLERTREDTPHQKLSANERRSQEQTLASLTEKSVLQAMAQLQEKGAADGTLAQETDSSDLISMIQQVTTQIVTAVLDSTGTSTTQASTSVTDPNPDQVNSVTKKAKIQSVEDPSPQQGSAKGSKSLSIQQGTAKGTEGPSPQQGTTKDTKGLSTQQGSAEGTKGPSPQQGTAKDTKVLSTQQGTMKDIKVLSTQKASADGTKGPSSQQGSAKGTKGLNTEQGSAEGTKGPSPQQGTAKGTKGLSPQQGTAKDTKVLSTQQGTMKDTKVLNTQQASADGTKGPSSQQGSAKGTKGPSPQQGTAKGTKVLSTQQGTTKDTKVLSTQQGTTKDTKVLSTQQGTTKDTKVLSTQQASADGTKGPSSQQGSVKGTKGLNTEQGSAEGTKGPSPQQGTAKGTKGPSPQQGTAKDTKVLSTQQGTMKDTKVLNTQQASADGTKGPSSQQGSAKGTKGPSPQQSTAKGTKVLSTQQGTTKDTKVLSTQQGTTKDTKVLSTQQGTTKDTKVLSTQQASADGTKGPSPQQGTAKDTKGPSPQQGTAKGTKVLSIQQGTTKGTKGLSTEQGSAEGTKGPSSQQGSAKGTKGLSTEHGSAEGTKVLSTQQGTTKDTKVLSTQQGTMRDTKVLSTQQGTMKDTKVPSTQQGSAEGTKGLSTQQGTVKGSKGPSPEEDTAKGSKGPSLQQGTAKGSKGPSPQQGSAEGTKGSCPQQGSAEGTNGPSPQQGTADGTKGVSPQQGNAKSTKAKLEGPGSPCPKQGTFLCSKAKNKPVVSPCVQLGTAATRMEETAHAVDQRPEPVIASGDEAANDGVTGLSPHQGTAGSGKAENQGKAAVSSQPVNSKAETSGVARPSPLPGTSGSPKATKWDVKPKVVVGSGPPCPGKAAVSSQPVNSKAETSGVARPSPLPGTSGPPKTMKWDVEPKMVVRSGPPCPGEASVSSQPVSIKAETSGVASPSPQEGTSGPCKAENKDVEQELVLGSTPPCPVTGEQVAKPRVWICGDSLVVSAQKWDMQNRHFGQLDWLQQSIILEWHGQEDLAWTQLVPMLQKLAAQGQAPDVLILHLGEKDFRSTPWPELRIIIKKELDLLKEVFPNVKVMWSEMLPQNIRPAEGDACKVEQMLQEANLVMGGFVSDFGGTVIKHVEMPHSFPVLKVDGSGLSHVGLELFLEDIKDTIRAHVLQSSGTASGGLKEGGNVSPLAPSADSASLVFMKEEAAVQGDHVVSSSEEASQIPRNIGRSDSFVGHGKIQTVEQKDILETFHFCLRSLEPSSDSPGSSPEPRVWICGDSTVLSAQERASGTAAGSQLGLEQRAILEWHGQEKLAWIQLLPFLQNLLTWCQAPDALIIHLGGEDLVRAYDHSLTSRMKKECSVLRTLFPRIRVIWSEAFPQGVWREQREDCGPKVICTETGRSKTPVPHSREAGSEIISRGVQQGRKDIKRIDMSKVMGCCVENHGGDVIKHPRIVSENPKLYLDEANLSPAGLDIFLKDIRNGILAYVLQAGGATGGGLKEGMSPPPPASPAAPTGLDSVSHQEVATQEDEVVSSTEEASSMRTSTGEAAMSSQPVSSKAENAGAETPSPQAGTSGTHKAEDSDVELKPLCSGSPEHPSKPLIWICGHSLVDAAREQAAATSLGSELGLEKEIILEWHGCAGLMWAQLVPFLQDLATYYWPPDMLIIHVGENDLMHTPSIRFLIKTIQRELFLVKELFPNVKVVWSEMTPWPGVLPCGLLKKVNHDVGWDVKDHRGIVIKHPGLSSEDPKLYTEQGTLNDAGLDMFLEDIKSGILAHLHHLRRAGRKELKEGVGLLPPASPATPASQEIATREEKTVSSTEEASGMQGYAGEAVVRSQPVSSKAKKSGMARPSPQTGTSGTRKAKNRVKKKKVLESVPPGPGEAAVSSQPVSIKAETSDVANPSPQPGTSGPCQAEDKGVEQKLIVSIPLSLDKALEAEGERLGPQVVKRLKKQKSKEEAGCRTLERRSGKTLGGEKKKVSRPAVPQKKSMRGSVSHKGPLDAKAKSPEAGDTPSKGGLAAEGTNKELPVGAPIEDASVAPPPPHDRVEVTRKEVRKQAGPVDLSPPEVKAEPASASSSSLGKEEKVPEKANAELLGNASTSTARDKDQELVDPAGELSEELEGTAITGGIGADPAKTEQGAELAPAICETVLLGSAEAPVEELSGEDLQSNTKLAPPGTDHTDTSRNLPESSASEVRVVAEKEPETPSSTMEVSMEVEPETTVLEITEPAKGKTTEPAKGKTTEPAKGKTTEPAKGKTTEPAKRKTTEPAKGKTMEPAKGKTTEPAKTGKVEAASEKQPEVLISMNKSTQEEKLEKKADDGSLSKSQSRKEMGQDWPEESSKAEVFVTEATSASMSVPNISKKRTVTQRKQEQKPSVRPVTRSSTVAEKKPVTKEASNQRTTNSRSPLPDSKSKQSLSSLVVKAGSGKSSSQQDKDSQEETKGSSKQPQEQEARPSTTKRDSSKEKVFAGRNTRSSNSGRKPKEEEEHFPFNLGESVTVAEVTDEVDSPSQPRRNPQRGKRKEAAHEPSSKRRKGKTSAAHEAAEQELSFATLDEIGENKGGMAQVAEHLEAVPEHLEAVPDSQVLVTVDEANDEEDLISEVARDPQALVTSDEVSEQEDPAAQEAMKEADGEPDLKAEPLITVDETEEEPCLNKPLHSKTETVHDRREEKEEAVAATAPERETAAAVAEPREGLPLDAKQEETVIPEDASPEEQVCPGEDLPEENKASEAQMEVAEKEGVAAEIDMQETTLVETEKGEGGEDLEETLKEETEAEAQLEPPLAEPTLNLTERPDSQGSDMEDRQQPSESGSPEEDVEAKATEMDVEGCSESATPKEQTGDAATAAPAQEVSVGDSQTARGEDPEARSEQAGQDPGGKEESGSEGTPLQSSGKPEKECPGDRTASSAPRSPQETPLEPPQYSLRPSKRPRQQTEDAVGATQSAGHPPSPTARKHPQRQAPEAMARKEKGVVGPSTGRTTRAHPHGRGRHPHPQSSTDVGTGGRRKFMNKKTGEEEKKEG